MDVDRAVLLERFRAEVLRAVARVREAGELGEFEKGYIQGLYRAIDILGEVVRGR